jgi:hypothetical protein
MILVTVFSNTLLVHNMDYDENNQYMYPLMDTRGEKSQSYKAGIVDFGVLDSIEIDALKGTP